MMELTRRDNTDIIDTMVEMVLVETLGQRTAVRMPLALIKLYC